MNRRDFLKQAGMFVSLSGISFSPNLGFSQSQNQDHFFVLLRVDGGMDSTLGLDPKTHKALGSTDQKDIFLEYRPEDIFSHNNLMLGPSAVSLQKHKKDILTVNGVVMRRDTGHGSLRDYLSSGFGDGSQAYLPALLSSRFQNGPLGVLANESILTGREKVTTFNPNSLITSAESNNKNAIAALKLMQNRNSLFGKEVYNFVNTNDLQSKIRKKLTELNIEDSKEAIFKAIAETFISGVKGARPSYQASLDITAIGEELIELDTHDSHEARHLSSQSMVWNSVSKIFDIFKSVPLNGASLFDHTTFMVVTEFSRTPFLNPSLGKDHNAMTNSVLLAGKNINGGHSVGASHVINRKQSPNGEAIHIGSSINYKTGKLEANNENSAVGLIFPENVIKSVASCFEYEGNKDLLDMFPCKELPGIKKKT